MKRVMMAAMLTVSLLMTACGTDASSGEPSDHSIPMDPIGAEAEPFVFTRDNLPRLDGSTSTVPLAQVMCAVLLGEDLDQVADLVSFSKTTQSYRNLMSGGRDLVLAAEPSPEVLAEFKSGGRWDMTPFATDALVFVVNKNNPVDSLTVEQVRKIYTGEITNWSEVGGPDLDIVPFQRNQGAGSQTMFEKLVMDGLEPMEPPATWTANSMEGLLSAVREYDNSAAALGYTVYYYANDMEMAQDLKVLAIDGISPSAQAIRNGDYPFLNPYFVAIRKNLPQDNPTRILYEWILGPEGQKLAQLEGYVPVEYTDTSSNAGSNVEEVSSAPEPVPDSPAFYVQADWSRLEGARTASQPDVDGGRWYPEFTDSLIPREDYGPLVPYWGSLAYPVQRWEDSTGETQEYWYDWGDAYYGLMTREGKIVVDPVYQNAFSYSYRWQGEELSLPVLILYRSDPAWAETGGARYAVAAEDGSWTTDFEFLLYTNRGDQLLLLGLQGITRLDSTTGAQRNWTWEELGVREEDVSQTLGLIQWGYGLTWTEHGVMAGTYQEESDDSHTSTRFRIFQPDTGEIFWVDGGQWDAWRDENFDQWQGRAWEMSRKGSQITLSSNGESYVIPDAPADCWFVEVRNGLAHLQSNSDHQLRRLSDGELLLEGAYIEFIPDAVHPERLGCVSVQNGKDYTIYDADLNPILILSLPQTGSSWLQFKLRDGLLSYYCYGDGRFGCWDLDAGRYIFYRNLYFGD